MKDYFHRRGLLHHSAGATRICPIRSIFPRRIGSEGDSGGQQKRRAVSSWVAVAREHKAMTSEKGFILLGGVRLQVQ